MKIRRIICVMLTVLTIAACAAVAGTAVASGANYDVAGTSAYQDMLSKTTNGNYNLADSVNEGTILQAWNWSFTNIEANLEKVASQGFTTIQVSPPNVLKADTKGVHVIESDGKNGWWMFYQPAGFQLNTSADNNSALGTKDQFISMCNKAHELGLKIIVDAVINHMGTCDNEGLITSTDPMKHLTPKAQQYEPEIYNAKAFHSPWQPMEYFENGDETDSNKYWSAYDLTRRCTSRLPDLDTSTTIVQTAIYDYLKELVEAGADGFRFDAAKHIETHEDPDSFEGNPTIRSNFWENTIRKIKQEYSSKNIYAYGEILNTCGIGRSFKSYTKFMDVTDSSAYWNISDAVKGGMNPNATPSYPNSNFTSDTAVLWDESHDTYMEGSTSNTNVIQRGKIWALSAGRANISTVYFARPDDTATSKQGVENLMKKVFLGDVKSTSWADKTTREVNRFHNYFLGKSEYCTANQSSTAYIERGDEGAILVKLGSATTSTVNLTNHKLKPGTYKDSITGNTFSVTSGKISGKIGDTGVACLYYDNDTVPTTPTSATHASDVPTRDGYYTVIFTNALGWTGTHHIYYWDSATNQGPEKWPGVDMYYYDVDDEGYVRYIGYVPMEYDMFIVNNKSWDEEENEFGEKTVDLSISDHTGCYATTKSSEGYNAEFYDIGISIHYVPTTPSETGTQQTEPTGNTDNTQNTQPTDPTGPTSGTEPSETGKSYTIGDADLNSKVDITDATAIQRHLAKIITLSAENLKAADVDEDKAVNIVDATNIQRFLAKIPTGTRCGETVS